MDADKIISSVILVASNGWYISRLVFFLFLCVLFVFSLYGSIRRATDDRRTKKGRAAVFKGEAQPSAARVDAGKQDVSIVVRHPDEAKLHRAEVLSSLSNRTRNKVEEHEVPREVNTVSHSQKIPSDIREHRSQKFASAKTESPQVNPQRRGFATNPIPVPIIDPNEMREERVRKLSEQMELKKLPAKAEEAPKAYAQGTEDDTSLMSSTENEYVPVEPWNVETYESQLRKQNEARQNLVRAQDEEYEHFAEMDKRREMEKKMQAERQEQAKDRLGLEPDPGTPQVISLKIFLPNGESRLRRFLKSDSSSKIFDVIIAESGILAEDIIIQRAEQSKMILEPPSISTATLEDIEIENLEVLRASIR